ncbi:lysine transporter LysE [Bacterioplanes sanyensis]|uniref:Lysine transporter LysE n=1 Tax=Bacterioplanes sanyensis TaxID=1249553 RepID=A0A222FME5_9GAMM|nr:LysE family translocator [Bacterioplanes sanyensis]ASP39842.1 lysine transporter LysE [Bacterioplanes sanyensis]
MSPGPSLAMIFKHSLAGGRLNGIVAAWSHAMGIGVYAVLTVLGLSYALQQAEWLFKGISLLGAGYLAYLGWKAIRSDGGVAASLQRGEAVSLWQSAKEGALISLLNPKIALFFIALFSQFISTEPTNSAWLLLVLTPLIVDGLWYTLIALLLSYPAITQILQQRAVIIDRLSGGILLLLAARVVTQM